MEGSRFKMSYTSLTIAGQFRDPDRWHVHQVQTDRFVVVLGEMTLALCDQRKGSPTEGNLEVVRLIGIPISDPIYPTSRDLSTYLLPVPPGVLHALGNISSAPFLYQNFPTELYSPADEGRVPFSELNVPSLHGPFSWNLVQRRAHP
jgi:dTDP-4-dehydrorhamnose 3,5-epimerase-like enzyme